MGFLDFLSDVVAAAAPYGVAEAEQPLHQSITGGASPHATPATEGVHEGEGEVKDPSGATAGKRMSNDDDSESGSDQSSGDATEAADDGDDAEETEARGDQDAEAADDDDDEEEEEEDEPETVDPKEKFEEECKESRACAPYKHHFDECSERVHKETEAGQKPSEDCVEEFFHLSHCATQCAAPKLWNALK